jgi:hypothetical protein
MRLTAKLGLIPVIRIGEELENFNRESADE